MLIDLHVHSSVSDGTDTPTRLVFNAHAAGLDAIALCDHDTFDGIQEATEAGKRIGVQVLGGVEMSAQLDNRQVHILGYGCQTWNAPLLAELAKVRVGRTDRIQATLDILGELGQPITYDEVRAAAGASPSIGRPHVADAMVVRGYVRDRQEAFDTFLSDTGPAYVPRYAPHVIEAIRLIRGANGLAVLAHPWGRGMGQYLTSEVITELAAHDLEGIEVDHPDHDPQDRELLTELGFRLGLIRTGSSDYHGLGKRHNPLGVNTTRASGYREILRRIAGRGGVVPA